MQITTYYDWYSERPTNMEELLESIKKRLEVLIYLTIRDERDDTPRSLRKQIALLSGLKLKPTEIAEILGKTAGHINKELSGIRRAERL